MGGGQPQPHLGGTICSTPGGALGLLPRLDLQALDLPEQLGGILVKLHEVHRFACCFCFFSSSSSSPCWGCSCLAASLISDETHQRSTFDNLPQALLTVFQVSAPSSYPWVAP